MQLDTVIYTLVYVLTKADTESFNLFLNSLPVIMSICVCELLDKDTYVLITWCTRYVFWK